MCVCMCTHMCVHVCACVFLLKDLGIFLLVCVFSSFLLMSPDVGLLGLLY